MKVRQRLTVKISRPFFFFGEASDDQKAAIAADVAGKAGGVLVKWERIDADRLAVIIDADTNKGA